MTSKSSSKNNLKSKAFGTGSGPRGLSSSGNASVLTTEGGTIAESCSMAMHELTLDQILGAWVFFLQRLLTVSGIVAPPHYSEVVEYLGDTRTVHRVTL